jgi:prepilin-type N-terminal cleavage/methylation domain-containing protein
LSFIFSNKLSITVDYIVIDDPIHFMLQTQISDCSSIRRTSVRENGMTLVELLVVLAIIASLAGLVYPAIMDSIKKSQASLAAQRIDAVEKAKVQYRLDNVDAGAGSGSSSIDSKTLQPSDLAPYLTRFGQPIASYKDLDKGTGGTITINTLSSRATFSPDSTDQKFISLLQQYGVLPDPGNSSGSPQ